MHAYQTLDLLGYELTDGSGRLRPFNLPVFMVGATLYSRHVACEQTTGGMGWSNGLMVRVGG